MKDAVASAIVGATAAVIVALAFDLMAPWPSKPSSAPPAYAQAAHGDTSAPLLHAGMMAFGSGVLVNTATGDVSLPQGLTITDAAKQFWNAVAQVRGAAVPFPEVVKP